MRSIFLTAQWQNLLMINYEIDPQILKAHLPYQTELDDFQGKHYVSLVGFLFKDTRVMGISVPFHQTFEEVNLRFYVRCRDGDRWRRGVVFIKEIVPRHMITLVANTLYGEKYETRPMRHQWVKKDDNFFAAYEWKVGHEWNWIRANASIPAQPMNTGSIEEFITEHYWGYTYINDGCTGVYEVQHPSWKIHTAKDVDVYCNAALLYGVEFSQALNKKAESAFIARGSSISVLKGDRLYKQKST